MLLGLKAYDLNGKALNWEADEQTLIIKPEQFDSMRKSGISAQLNIDVPEVGGIHLVTAVYDLTSGMGGTVEIPLQATALGERRPARSK